MAISPRTCTTLLSMCYHGSNSWILFWSHDAWLLSLLSGVAQMLFSCCIKRHAPNPLHDAWLSLLSGVAQMLFSCCIKQHAPLFFIIFPVKQSLGVMYRNQYVCLLRDIILSKHVIWIFLKFYTFINYHMKMYSFFIFHHFTCILFYLWLEYL